MAAKSKWWIVVANSSFAEIYAFHPARDFHRIRYIENPEGRKKSGEIINQRPGRSNTSMRTARYALSPRTDIHKHEQQLFAQVLSDHLEQGVAENAYERLALICPPKFLGELRSCLSENVRKLVNKEFNKELSESMSENERIEQIFKLLEIKKPAHS